MNKITLALYQSESILGQRALSFFGILVIVIYRIKIDLKKYNVTLYSIFFVI